ncbi:hypothetical protein FIBSPDRAFT_855024 [Athelia psychrophila]|uniref:Uncharacterized protein n=1 Tax=Athelia psychrophila TaxID=1759441 RepID=A0A166PRZ2_9AGAM|nr:hypothetical protein FIBSPDRAFT_855024 [Fibularhizoctonia sp. CBS 109695]
MCKPTPNSHYMSLDWPVKSMSVALVFLYPSLIAYPYGHHVDINDASYPPTRLTSNYPTPHFALILAPTATQRGEVKTVVFQQRHAQTELWCTAPGPVERPWFFHHPHSTLSSSNS